MDDPPRLSDGAGPRLIVGWRPSAGSHRLAAERVPTHERVHPTLIGAAQDAIARLADSRGRPYEPAAELESGQYFEVEINTVRVLPPHGAPSPSQTGPEVERRADRQDLEQVADLIRITRDVDALPELNAGQLREGKFLFHGIVAQTDDGNVAFINRHDPVHELRKGAAFLRYADALVEVERPDFMLYPDIDVVVTRTHVYAFNKSALQRLLADARLILQDVPVNVELVRESLPEELPITEMASDAVRAFSSKRVTFAARLRSLPERVRDIALNPDSVRAALQRHGEDPSLLVNDQGQLDFGEDEVEVFFDLIEGRWYADEFSGEERTANRFSRRRPLRPRRP